MELYILLLIRFVKIMLKISTKQARLWIVFLLKYSSYYQRTEIVHDGLESNRKNVYI